MLEVIWENRAENDLAEYQEYIHQFNPKASVDVVERIFDCVETIAEQPLMGKPGKINGTREFAIPDLPITLIYRIKEASLVIVFLHHHRKMRG